MVRNILWGIIVVVIGIGAVGVFRAQAGPPSRWSDSGGAPSPKIEDIDEEVVPLAPVQTPAGPVLAPPPASPQAAPPPSSYGARISTLPPSTGGSPPPQSSARASKYAIPPAPAYGGSSIQPTRSDLPAGWEQPVQLPPGAVPLENVKSPISSQSSWPIASGASRPPAAAAPMPTPTPSGPEPEETEEVIEKAAKPPSRWQ